MRDRPAGMSRGDWYDSVYERREAAGDNVHGEADFIMSYAPGSLLDSGCGTGRVGRELARRGVRVVGIDIDPEMLETARRKAPGVSWIRDDVTLLRLADRFDIVLMAGNVINFIAPDRRALAVKNMAGHVRSGGLLIDGHSLKAADAQLADYDEWAAAAELEPTARWSTWQRDPFESSSSFAVSVFSKVSP
ncbi:MAG: class I SAM-dependent methyltransferase [Candidatus Dormibacteraceae bacterium]